MRFVFYLFIFSQLLNFVSVLADKYTKESPELKIIKWKKIQEKNSNDLKKIIWKSYKDDESYFQNKNKLMESFNQDQKGAPFRETDLIQTNKWRFRPSHQWYFDAQRKGGSSRDIHLLSGKVDWMGGDWWYLTGQGLSAYGGGASGYSEGYLGVGVLSPRWKKWQLYGEILIGAGGGGGVDSGSALLYKPSVGLEYNLSKVLSLQTGIGKVISKEGNLDANTLDASLVWRFGTPN